MQLKFNMTQDGKKKPVACSSGLNIHCNNFSGDDILKISILILIIFLLYKFLPSIYAFRSSVAYQKQNTDTALKYLKKAVDTGRASYTLKLRYALMLLRSGKPEDALQNFNLILIDPKSGSKEKNTAKQYRCMAYIKLGNIEDALEESTELLGKIKSSELYAIAGYAMTLSGKENKEILEFCEEAYKYNPDNRDIADNYAVALIGSNQFKKAIEVCDKIIEKNRFFPEGHFHKAQSLYNQGKTKEASDELELLEDCDFSYLTTVTNDDIDELTKLISEKEGE